MKLLNVKASNSSTLTNYAILHALVDGVCAAMMCGMITMHAEKNLAWLFVLYNTLAFATQGITGIFADSVKNKNLLVKLAVMLVAAGFLFPWKYGITVKVIMAGLGNSLFHTAAGASVLYRSRYKATPIGYFVAPGIVGLTIGSTSPFWGYAMLVFMMFVASAPDNKGMEYELMLDSEPERKHLKIWWAALPVMLLILCIMTRSYFGSVMTYTWHPTMRSTLLVALAIAAGKAAGGFIYDRIGGIWLSLAAFPAAAALMIYSSDSMPLSMLGQLLVSVSMPVTLLLIYKLIPKHPGFAFGLSASVIYPAYMLSRLYRSGTLPITFTVFTISVFALNLVIIVLTEILIRIKTKGDSENE